MTSQTRITLNRIARRTMLVFVWVAVFLLVALGAGLLYKAWPALVATPFKDLLLSSEWLPYEGKFGLLPFILSTFWVTGVALIIAVPLCLLASIYLSEYANKRVIAWVSPLIDILAGLPSVIFGIWGVIVIVPLIRDYIGPALGVSSPGYSILAGGIVLSIMVFPIIIYVLLEVFRTIPVDLKNAALSLGANKWIMIRKVLLRKAMPGIISAVVLGFSRAFGETLAVLMVVGNVEEIPHSVLDPGYPLPALIASKYHEVLSIPTYESALMLCAFVLFIIIVFFNVIARIILRKVEKKIS
jgi:phosphate transport system permease protein